MIRPAHIAFAALTLLTLAMAGCGGDDPTDLLADAELAESGGDLRQAIASYTEAARVAPENSFVRWRLSKVLLRARRGAEAERQIHLAVRLRAGENRTRPALAEALYLQGRYRDVVDLATEELDQSNKGVLLAFQSRAHIALGHLDEAEAALRQARALSPYLPEVGLAQADLSIAKGALDDAQAALRRVDMIERDNPYAAALHGELAARRGDAAAAGTHFAEALAQQFPHWHDRLMHARFLLDTGDIAAAVGEAGSLVDAHPDQPEVIDFAQRAWTAHGDLDRAADLLRRRIETAPSDAQASYRLARLEFRRGRPEQARQLADAVLALTPGHPGAVSLLARLALQRAEPEAAETLLRPLMAAQPTDIEAGKLLTASLIAQRRWDAADQVIDRLLPLLPDDIAAQVADARSRPDREEATAAGDAISAAFDVDALPTISAPRVADAVATSARQPLQPPAPPAQTSEPLSATQADAKHLLFKAARQDIADGETAAAADALRRVLAIDTSSYEALAGLVELSIRNDGEPDVTADLERAIAESPRNTDFLVLQAEYAESRADWNVELQALEAILANEPMRDDVRARIAMLQLHRFNAPDAALRVLTGREASTDPNLRATLAEIYYELGDIDRATAAFQSLRALAPALIAPYMRLAALCEVKGNSGGAQALLERLVSLAPGDAYAELAAARLQAARGNTPRARDLVGRSAVPRDDPERIRTQLDIALHEQAFDEAVRVARSLYEHEPGPVAMLTLARVLAHNADWEPAIELLEQRQIRAPDDTYALGDLAAAYAATGQAQKKLAVLESLARLRPDDAAVLNNLAWALRESDAERAASLARRAHEIAPESFDVADTLAAILAGQRDFPDAIDIASQVIESSGSSAPRMRLRRAEIQLLAGNTDDALHDLRAIDPEEIPVGGRERRMLMLHALQP